MQIRHTRPDLVVKRAIFLAYQAAQLNEEQAWSKVALTKSKKDGGTDEPQDQVTTIVVGQIYTQISATIYYSRDTITVPDSPITEPANHPWMHKYPTWEALIQAAIVSITPEISPNAR